MHIRKWPGEWFGQGLCPLFSAVPLGKLEKFWVDTAPWQVAQLGEQSTSWISAPTLSQAPLCNGQNVQTWV